MKYYSILTDITLQRSFIDHYFRFEKTKCYTTVEVNNKQIKPGMSHLFVEPDHSEMYHKYRPRHPKEVYESIDRKLTETTSKLPDNLEKQYKRNQHKRWNAALDVGCGTGLSTLMLMDYVQEAFGIDTSESQISKAKTEYGNKDPSRVTFLCEDSLKISQLFKENTIDLIVVGQAIHWFHDPKFYEECMKVLRPGGVLALFGYGDNVLEDERAQRIYQEFCPGITKDWEDSQVTHLFDGYQRIFADIKPLYPNAEKADPYFHHLESTVDDLVGYWRSRSAYRKYKMAHPEHPDILDDVRDKLKQIYPGDSLLKRKTDYFIIFVTKE